MFDTMIPRIALVCVCSLAGPAVASSAADAADAAGAPLTVAVLGFEAVGGAEPAGGAGLSELMNDVLEAMLSGEDGLSLVDRTRLDRTVAEQAVSRSGVTDTAQAVAIGRVVGARLLVTGRAFELGESRVVTAKVIGTETTRTRSVMVRESLDTPLDEMVFEAAERMVALLGEHGRELVAGEVPRDPVPGLVATLRERGGTPVMAVVIPEEHVRGPAPAPAVPDPAVETEIKKVLIDAGVDVRDLKDNALADWVRAYDRGDEPSWPRSLEGVDWVVVGEGFSEGAGAMGRLRFANARAEINVVRREDGRIVLADRVTTRGVDLAEQVAGKSALQKAGRRLVEGLLRRLIEEPPAD
ncbi:CsgG/HfaB family protein [Phycisphaera mikurensis]|uniref:Curli production assembly/transport component CsgG n=1 Tax=Phycisphaera mikurensis (strain NBRC 102666 / KCTC 22515 / FYK2301M01) TaxID=1142394 RepID=I0IHA8_PHYMF|nr:CsgG/HfaB family protein [Phycisphaera mikurensis]MBB6440895.1 hypothetical protein [Phycisphaera mikurensis]BAM04646.1 hypothetical protein PSMK_24870 [Phycisphaera mikurensis NBRC 102666]